MPIPNELPTITQLSPPATFAGSPAFNLSITGANFVRGSSVHWNGCPRKTIFVSTTQLQAVISAFDVATAGTAIISVCTPGPCGCLSNELRFTRTSPAPAIVRLSPTSTPAGGPAFTLNVFGKNFIPDSVVTGSVVRWNGKERKTKYVSSTQLTATILASDIEQAGIASVTVLNRTPHTTNVNPDCDSAPSLAQGDSAPSLAQGDSTYSLTPGDSTYSLTPGDSTSNPLSFAVTSNNFVLFSAARRMDGTKVAPDSIALIAGAGLTTMGEEHNPPQIEVAGLRVYILDDQQNPHLAMLFAVENSTPDTLTFLVPSAVAPGRMDVQVTNGITNIVTVSKTVATVAPGLFSANESGSGLADATAERINASGPPTGVTIAQFDGLLNQWASNKIDLGQPSDQVFLILKGTGIRFRASILGVTAQYSAVSNGFTPPSVTAVTVETDPLMEGRDIISVLIPHSLSGRGLVNVTLTVDGETTNTVQIDIL